MSFAILDQGTQSLKATAIAAGVSDSITSFVLPDLWLEDTEHTSFTSPLAADLDGDSRDEILMIRGLCDYRGVWQVSLI